jgi:hypothetical protein
MPCVNYEEVSREISKIRAQRLELYPDFRRRAVSRMKDPEEIETLIHLDLLRMRKWERDGKLVYLGNRTYRLSINSPWPLRTHSDGARDPAKP